MTEPTHTPSAEEILAMHPELVPPSWGQRVAKALGAVASAFTATVVFAAIITLCVGVLFLSVWAIVAAARGIAG